MFQLKLIDKKRGNTNFLGKRNVKITQKLQIEKDIKALNVDNKPWVILIDSPLGTFFLLISDYIHYSTFIIYYL